MAVAALLCEDCGLLSEWRKAEYEFKELSALINSSPYRECLLQHNFSNLVPVSEVSD